MKEERSRRKVATATALTGYLRLIRARRGSMHSARPVIKALAGQRPICTAQAAQSG
jgi:hypothetical protein